MAGSRSGAEDQDKQEPTEYAADQEIYGSATDTDPTYPGKIRKEKATLESHTKGLKELWAEEPKKQAGSKNKQPHKWGLTVTK